MPSKRATHQAGNGAESYPQPRPANQPTHQLSFTWDALGRQLSQTNPMRTIGSTWDLAGRRTRITYPGGAYFVDQDYLVTGEMAAIRENGATTGLGVIASFGYDLLGRRASLTRGNGVVTNYAYDPASRLQTLSNDVAGTSSDLSLGFAYNPAGQIVSNTRSNDLYSYTGAAAGSVNSTANGLNQLATHNGGAPTYDARGNITSEGGRTFSYSSENLLTGHTGTYNGTARTLAWTYDPLMRLHYQTTSGLNSRTYGMDGHNAILTYIATPDRWLRAVYGPGENEVLYQIDHLSRRTWFTADERGSIVVTTEPTGATGLITTYDEYGRASSLSYQHNYTGALIMGVSSLNYMRARVYDPTLGRFLQTDPIGYGDGMNMYGYVGEDPVNRTDPSGLSGCNTAESRLCPYWLEGRSDDTDLTGFRPIDGGQGAGGTFFTGSPRFDDIEIDRNGKRLERKWSVSGAQNGVVGQRIQSTFTRNGIVTTVTFYEAWEMRSGRWPVTGNRDVFSPPPGTTSATVRGTAYFFPGITIPSTMRPGQIPNSGRLPSSRDQPAFWLSPNRVGPVEIEWQCEPCN